MGALGDLAYRFRGRCRRTRRLAWRRFGKCCRMSRVLRWSPWRNRKSGLQSQSRRNQQSVPWPVVPSPFRRRTWCCQRQNRERQIRRQPQQETPPALHPSRRGRDSQASGQRRLPLLNCEHPCCPLPNGPHCHFPCAPVRPPSCRPRLQSGTRRYSAPRCRAPGHCRRPFRPAACGRGRSARWRVLELSQDPRRQSVCDTFHKPASLPTLVVGVRRPQL